MEKQKFTQYKFSDQRTGDIIQYMQINDKLGDHDERLKKMQIQLSVETRIPVAEIVYGLGYKS
ncbi:MAG TPA: hypothetical protein DIT07_09915 [Sphingobacteriaceae bacterium]|nr:hypothetical protein [Sphingobacteriaceae bacterium]